MMKLSQHLNTYRNMLAPVLSKHGIQADMTMSGVDAWTLAHNAGIVKHAYSLGRDIYDAHIQTALEKLLPGAVFKDSKRY